MLGRRHRGRVCAGRAVFPAHPWHPDHGGIADDGLDVPRRQGGPAGRSRSRDRRPRCTGGCGKNSGAKVAHGLYTPEGLREAAGELIRGSRFMNVSATKSSRRAIPRADFGRVTVFFGDRNGKYPDANQVIVRGSDTQAAFDTPIVANHIGEAFDASDLVILGHVHEDHMAALHRLPNAPVHVHEADLAAAQSWDGLRAAYGSDESYVAEMFSRFQRDFFYAPRPDAIGYSDGAVWELGQSRVRAFHAPGHTAGHCVLLVEPEGVAFIGDIDLSGFGPYYGDASSSLSDFR